MKNRYGLQTAIKYMI